MKMNKSINDEILKILNKVGISGDISRITILDEDYLTVVLVNSNATKGDYQALFRLPVNEEKSNLLYRGLKKCLTDI